MAVLIPQGKQQYFDGTGDPLVGGKLYTYSSGTDTFLPTWKDKAQTIENTNPIILDARGEAVVFWLGTYKVVLEDALGNIIWTVSDMVAQDILAELSLTSGAAGIGADDEAGGTIYNNVQGYIDTVGSANGAKRVGYGPTVTVNDALNVFFSSDGNNMQGLVGTLLTGAVGLIECWGDSTQFGYDAVTGSQVALPSPAEFQAGTNNFIGGGQLSVVNKGISSTTLTQMITGTNGYPTTFETAMIASSASVIFCNHGVNDAFSAFQTSEAQYRDMYVQFVRICRKYGKVPVIETPFPCASIGTFGSQARVEATARFAQIAREVAEELSVVLVDQHRYLTGRIEQGISPLSLFPDGVHGTNNGAYIFAGINKMEALFASMAPVFTQPGQIASVSEPFVRCTSPTYHVDAGSRGGTAVTTAAFAAGQSMSMIFKVDGPELDISLGQLLFAAGGVGVDASIDGLPPALSLNQNRAGYDTVFWHDVEIPVSVRCPPGFHILIMNSIDTRAVTGNFLRSRQTQKPKLFVAGGVVSTEHKLLTPALELTTANGVLLCDDLPVDWLYEALELTFTAQLQGESGLAIGGYIGDFDSALPTQALVFGTDGIGQLGVYVNTAPATFVFHVLDATQDWTAASHDFGFRVGTDKVISATIDGVAATSTYAMTELIQSGLLGLWHTSGTKMIIHDLTRIWRSA